MACVWWVSNLPRDEEYFPFPFLSELQKFFLSTCIRKLEFDMNLWRGFSFFSVESSEQTRKAFMMIAIKIKGDMLVAFPQRVLWKIQAWVL